MGFSKLYQGIRGSSHVMYHQPFLALAGWDGWDGWEGDAWIADTSGLFQWDRYWDDTDSSFIFKSSRNHGKHINKHNQLKDDSTTWHKLILSIKKQTKDVGPICLRFPRSMVVELTMKKSTAGFILKQIMRIQ